MKIAIIHSFYTAATPSGENITVEMQAKALANAGHDVKIIEARTDVASKANFYKIRTAINVASGRGQSPLEELQDYKPDIVHVHNLFPNFSTSWLSEWDGPLVATLHNFRPLCSNGLMFRDGHQCSLCPEYGSHNAVRHACYRNSRIATLPIAIRNRHGAAGDSVIQRANAVIVLSARSYRTYEEFGASTDKFTIVPNFIEPTLIPTPPTPENDNWLYAGRLNPEKGIVDLLQKWPPREKILIAGAGSDEEIVRRMELVDERITYVGSLPREELLVRLATAKGVVIPSLCAENLPTIYLEALAAGKPVIAHTGNSAADDIDGWAPGMTYASAAELASAITKFTTNRKDLGVRARRHFETAYTQQAWLQAITNVYKSALAGFTQNPSDPL